MTEAKRSALRTALLLILGALSGCDREICFGHTARCEGDVWVHCPGGWLNGFSLTPERENCRDQGKRCTSNAPHGSWTGCLEPLGACDAATFKPYCDPGAPGSTTGVAVVCVQGEKLRIGEYCEVSTASSSAAPAPSASF